MPGMLHHSQARIVQVLLIEKGVVSSPSSGDEWPIFATKEPDKPDNCLTVYNTEGVVNGCSQLDGEYWEQHGIQIRIRCALDEVGYLKAKEILLVLDKEILRDSVTVDTTDYCIHSINRTSDVLSLGDVPFSSRRLFTINALTYLIEI